MATGDQAGEGATPVFRGVTELALDAKGRFAIPARHRDAIVAESGSRLVLTADPSRCLLLYPLAAWEPIQSRLMALSSFDERLRQLQRLIVGHADDNACLAVLTGSHKDYDAGAKRGLAGVGEGLQVLGRNAGY